MGRGLSSIPELVMRSLMPMSRQQEEGVQRMARAESPREARKCPECDSEVIVRAAGELCETVCGQCGLVLEEQSLDTRPEWKAYTSEEKDSRSRIGTPTSILLADKGLPTVVPKDSKDSFGHSLSSEARIKMWRMRRLQSQAHHVTSKERNLVQAMSELDRIADKLHIPREIQEEAARIYREVLHRDMVRGRSTVAMVAASLYAACRVSNRPRTLHEIASVSYLKRKRIAQCYRLLLFELPLKASLPNPRTYVSKTASKFNLPEKIVGTAVQLLDKVDKKAITGRNPSGLAAAALYIACTLAGIKISQKRFAYSAGVTEVTVRNTYNVLKGTLQISKKQINWSNEIFLPKTQITA
ncbi:MAG: TFIIB-type zinc ribbon-containing protein [Candidatus Bathyarchaeota archaeon]